MANLDYNDHGNRVARHEHHVWIWKHVLTPCSKVVKRMKRYSYDDFGELESPFIVLCNHNTDLDPVLVGMAIDTQAYIVGSEHVLHKDGWSTILMKHVCPIIHQKGLNGISTMRNTLKAIREGYNVILFPEGNRSFNGETCEISPATAKLVKKSGANLLTMRLEGGYLNQPRWCMTNRKGKMFGKKMHFIKSSELKKMSDEEVYDLICSDLYENAFERQRLIAQETGSLIEFKGDQLALGLESLVFMCPECKSIGSIETHDDMVECKCGHSAKYLSTGFIYGSRFDTLLEWDKWQKQEFEKIIEEAFDDTSMHSRSLLSDEITLMKMGSNHRVAKSWHGNIALSIDGLTFESKDMVRRIPIEDIIGFAIYSRNTIVIHIGKEVEHLEIRGSIHFNALKYRYALDKVNELRYGTKGE